MVSMIFHVLNNPQSEELSEDKKVELAWQYIEELEPWFEKYLRQY